MNRRPHGIGHRWDDLPRHDAAVGILNIGIDEAGIRKHVWIRIEARIAERVSIHVGISEWNSVLWQVRVRLWAAASRVVSPDDDSACSHGAAGYRQVKSV